MAEPQIPNPKTVWLPSEMTEERIQALVDRGILGIPPHFDLWRYFYQVKKTGSPKSSGALDSTSAPG